MCYKKPGRRCTEHARHLLNTTFKRKEEAQEKLNTAIADNAPASVIEARQARLASWTAKAAEVDEAWEKTPAGIRHLEELAADESLDEVERRAAAKKAERYIKENENYLNSRHASTNRDAALAARLKEDGVRASRIKTIMELPRDSTYGELNVIPSATALKSLEHARAAVDSTETEVEAEIDQRTAALETLENRAAALAERAERGEDVAKEQEKVEKKRATAEKNLTKAKVEGRQRKLDAADSVAEAQAAYDRSPQGLKKLKEEAAAEEKSLQERLSRIEEIENDPGIVHSEAALPIRNTVESWAKDNRDALRKHYANRIAVAKGSEKSRLQAEFKARDEQFSEKAVNVMVRKQMIKKAVGDREKAAQRYVELKKMQSRIRLASELKDRATANKSARLVLERAIRFEYGDNQEGATAAIKEYRANRKNYARKSPGGRAPVHPDYAITGTHTTYFTPDELAEVRQKAEAEGLSVTNYVRSRANRAPQETFATDVPLGRVQANVEDKVGGLGHRNRTVTESRRAVPDPIGASKVERARWTAMADTFHMTRSSYVRAMALDIDVRAIQNDRSDEHNGAKEAAMYEEHSTVERSDHAIRSAKADA